MDPTTGKLLYGVIATILALVIMDKLGLVKAE